jgi:hypothetical protein
MSEDDPVAAFRVEAADLLDQVERACSIWPGI